MLTILSQRLMKYSANSLLKAASKININKVKKLDTLYFGYGANLNVKRFHDKAMSAELIGTAILKDYSLSFSLPCEYKGKGYADIQEAKDQEVWGALFKINSYALMLLDIMEWVPFDFYRKIKVSVQCNDKVYKDVWAYQAVYPKFDLVPSKGYLDFIIGRSVENHAPEDYVSKLRENEYKEEFDFDTGFCLSSPNKRRILEDKLEGLYLAHDKIREKIAGLLP